MTQEQKDLLLKDLSARLPYGVKGLVTFNGNPSTPQIQEDRTIYGKLYDRFAEFQDSWYDNVTIKPYLFPMSSMTDEDYSTYCKIWEDTGKTAYLDGYHPLITNINFSIRKYYFNYILSFVYIYRTRI